MKNRVELFAAEFFLPIEVCEIFRHEISAISGEIFEITGAKIVDHRETRVREFFLQRKREIGADEPGATCDDKVGTGLSHRQITLEPTVFCHSERSRGISDLQEMSRLTLDMTPEVAAD